MSRSPAEYFFREVEMADFTGRSITIILPVAFTVGSYHRSRGVSMVRWFHNGIMEAVNRLRPSRQSQGPRLPLHPQPQGDHLSDRGLLELALAT
jgi:hypothetical protein